MKKWILVFALFLSWSASSAPLPASEIEDVVWRLRRGLKIDLYQRPTTQGPQVVALAKIPIVWITNQQTRILLQKLQSLLATQNERVDPAYNIYQWETMYPKRLTLLTLGVSLLDYGFVGYPAYQLFINKDPASAEKALPFAVAFSLMRLISYMGGSLFSQHEDQAWFKFPFFAYYVASTMYLESGTQKLEEIFRQAKQPGGIILLAAVSNHYKRLPQYLQKMGFKRWEPEKS